MARQVVVLEVLCTMTAFYVDATKIGDAFRTYVLASYEGELHRQISTLTRISLATGVPVNDFLPEAREWCATDVRGLRGLLPYAERNGRLPWVAE